MDVSPATNAPVSNDVERLSVAGQGWDVDIDFLSSGWRCLWGAGCKGVGDVAVDNSSLGCCSEGAELVDDDEARLISARAAMVDDDLFEHGGVREVGAGGVFDDERGLHTRRLATGCVFLNSSEFSGGAGCALHLQAERDGDPLSEWKPAVCWQLPVKVDWGAPDTLEDRSTNATDRPTATVRRWRRSDWGSGGDDIAWFCPEAPEAFVDEVALAVRLGDQLDEMVGTEVAVAIRARVSGARRSRIDL